MCCVYFVWTFKKLGCERPLVFEGVYFFTRFLFPSFCSLYSPLFFLPSPSYFPLVLPLACSKGSFPTWGRWRRKREEETFLKGPTSPAKKGCFLLISGGPSLSVQFVERKKNENWKGSNIKKTHMFPFRIRIPVSFSCMVSFFAVLFFFRISFKMHWDVGNLLLRRQYFFL